ncbi:uncharacterized protein [Mytilus edulis]|uniref:uncharacterized protein n=1 Tax=Mytilus edulis TaxID=6550 RepID=UPI0039EE38B0
MKVSEIICWTTFLVAACLILTDHCNANQYGICSINKRKVCCSAFELRNGTCKPCLEGYNSKTDSECKPCTTGKYGKKCVNNCKCNNTERCDHIKGCISVDASTKEKKNASKNNSQNQPTTSNGGDVVIYMTCVAVVSVLVVVCGLIVKKREAICTNQSGNKSVKHLIHKMKQSTSHNGHNKKVAESLYDEIDEKYMINFVGE